MIKIFDGDLLESAANIICHQVNCQKAMNSGVAKQVRNKFPNVYKEYMKVASSKMLGRIQIIRTDDCQYVCNLFAQDKYGHDGKQYTDIEALRKCLVKLRVMLDKSDFKDATIAMPYKIGCVRGGADWDTVYKMIDEIFKDYRVELWRLDKG